MIYNFFPIIIQLNKKLVDKANSVFYDEIKAGTIGVIGMKDIEVIEKARDGDEEAYEELYRRFYKVAYFYAFKVCRNAGDAQDIAQDVFLDIKRYLPTLRSVNSFRPWLYQMVSHRCSKMFRKQKHIQQGFDIEENAYAFKEHKIERIPEKNMHFTSDKEILMKSVDELPSAIRSVIVLFYLEQFSIKEITNILAVPEGTVKSRLSTGRKYLYKSLQAYESSNEPISFHAMDALLVAAMAESLQSTSLTGSFVMGSAVHNAQKGFRYIFSSAIPTKIAVFSCITLLGIGGVVSINESQKKASMSKNIVNNARVEYTFPAVEYQEETISSTRDAYFVLLDFAYDQSELQHKSDAEIDAIKPLYDAFITALKDNPKSLIKLPWELNTK